MFVKNGPNVENIYIYDSDFENRLTIDQNLLALNHYF